MNYFDTSQGMQLFGEKMESAIQSGDYQKVIDQVKPMLREQPDHPDLLFLLGKVFFSLREFPKANQFFYKAMNAGTTIAEHFAYYGWTFIKLNDYGRAEKYIHKAYECDANNPTTLLVQALLSYQQSDFQKAVKYCNKALLYREHPFELYRLKAYCLMKTGRPLEQVLTYVKKAKQYGEDQELDYEYAKLMYMNLQYDECKKFCRKFMIQYPNSEYRIKIKQLMNKIKEKENEVDSNHNARSNTDQKEEKGKQKQDQQSKKKKEPRPLSELLVELDSYIGLENVKKSIHDLINVVEINRYKQEKGLKAKDPIAPHMVFYGNPGTGKTTIARLVGEIFYSIGLLKEGQLIEVKREDLVGQFIGDTEKNTKEKIEEALGGVLFIDEAYTLAEKGGGSSNDFGMKAINVLLPALENHRGEFMVIVAGYKEEMELFLKSNPGLKDRFTQKIYFDDYTPEELLRIFQKICLDEGYQMADDANSLLYEKLISLYRLRDQTFSNGRLVRNLFQAIMTAQSNRIAKVPRSQWSKRLMLELTYEDVKKALSNNTNKLFSVPINEELLEHYLNRLNEMIGLQSVKAEIHQLVQLVRYYKQEGRDTKELIRHTLLLGNPGTGKTEVARIVAGIYEALGILQRGELIEVDRNGLVDKYRGGTEEKTQKVIESSLGGTLFIDEAYTLTNKDSHDPGHTAVEVLLKKMSDLEGQFMVIAAGYKKEMQQFVGSNSGLIRRFGLTLHFEDYTPEELLEITKLYINHQGYTITVEATEELRGHYEQLYKERNHSFGNAGLAKKLANESIQNLDYRMAMMPITDRTNEIKRIIEAGDLALLTK